MGETTVIETHIVNDKILPIRLIDFITKVCKTIHSRSGLKKAIKRGQFKVDGKIAGEGVWLQAGQKIELVEIDYKPPKVFELPLNIIFEDEHLSVIVKPSGFPVSGNRFKTIKNALLFNIKLSTEPDALKMPLPVHRLDSPTSGLLVIAKTSKAVINLGQQFEKKLIQKRYRAIVSGRTPKEGIIETAIEGQKSMTRYKLLKHGRSLHTQWMSVLDLFPETGRTHQLRIHLASIGFPILGDDKYGDVSVRLKGKGLFLSAVEISFLHPTTDKPFHAKIEQPEKFNLFFEREQRRWGKYL
ncbi:MAG: RluA family pseudouridine synthase [Bacteroidetes bacterium]|nr:MAG: RluA family pseudouridine synthase [Bacteroidota bacterium]